MRTPQSVDEKWRFWQTIIFLLVIAALALIQSAFGQSPIGTERRPVYTDSSNAVVNGQLSFTNNFTVSVTPTVPTGVARYMDITNYPVILGTYTNIICTAPIYGVKSGYVLTLTWSNDAGYVTASITNGLASMTALAGATNQGWVTMTITNGLVPTSTLKTMAYQDSTNVNVTGGMVSNTLINLAAGTSSVPPMKGTPGPLTTLAVTNSIEYDGTNIWRTGSMGNRASLLYAAYGGIYLYGNTSTTNFISGVGTNYLINGLSSGHTNLYVATTPSNLTIQVGGGGTYLATATVSGTASAASIYGLVVYKSGVAQTNITMKRSIAINGTGGGTCMGFLSLTNGDTVDMRVFSDGAGDEWIIKDANLIINRVGVQ